MNTIDIVVLVILTYFVFRGSKAGMIEELLGITGWVIAVILAALAAVGYIVVRQRIGETLKLADV